MISVADYYRKHVNKLIKSYSVLLENYDEESVYNLRLIYKRIRAINKFIKQELNGREFFNGRIDKVDNIYKNAGIIREIQVNLKLLNNYRKAVDKSFDEFAAFLDNKTEAVNSVLKQMITEINAADIRKAENKIYRNLAGTDERYIYVRSIKFIKRKNKKIKALISDSTDKDRYHAVRTNIKEIFFFLKLLYTRKEYNKAGFRSDYLKTLGIRLGDWHDNEVLLNNLYNYLNSDSSVNYDPSNSKYQELIDYINKEQNKRLKNIDRKIIKTNSELAAFIRKKETELIP